MQLYLPPSKANGFTILELLVAVAMAGTILAFAAPSIGQFQKKTMVNNSAKEFVSMLQMARAEAVRQNSFINIETQSTQSDNYAAELKVCATNAANGACTNGNTFKVYDFSNSKISIRSTGSETQSDNNISFNQRGQLADNQFALGFCESAGSNQAHKYLSINVTGRPFLTTFDSTAGHKCNPD